MDGGRRRDGTWRDGRDHLCQRSQGRGEGRGGGGVRRGGRGGRGGGVRRGGRGSEEGEEE